MNILELCNALQCDFDRFWDVLIWYWNSGFSWWSSWNVGGSGILRPLLHPIWWNATEVWKPFTIWPRGYRGGWSSRPRDKHCRAVEGPLYTDSCLINGRYTVARHEPFRHSSINSKGIDSGFGDVCWSWKKTRWDESDCVEVRLPCFFSMLVGSHNKLVVIGTWYCSPKPGLLGSGPSRKSQTQLEKLPAKPVRSDQFFPMNIFLL